MSVPPNDRAAKEKRHGGADSEEYPERYETLLLDGQRNEDERAQRGTREYRQEDTAPADETADHRHHLDVAAAHRLFLEHPGADGSDDPQQREAHRGAEQRLEETLHAPAKREQQSNDQTTPGELVGNDIVARIGDRDSQQQRPEQCRGDRVQCHSIDEQGGAKQHADEGLDEGILFGDRFVAPAALAAQPEPGEDRDIITPRDRLPAVRAGRARPQQRLIARQAQDADIEKAAHAQTNQHRPDEDDGINAHATPRTVRFPPRLRR